jgi:Ni,Fe-hydrogenase III component G
MSYSDSQKKSKSYEELRKKHGLSQKEEEELTPSQKSEKYQNLRKQSGLSYDQVDSNYINTFITDANNFLSSTQSDYGKVKWSNASSVYDTRYKTWQNLTARSASISNWLSANKSRLDKETYDSLSSAINGFRSEAAQSMTYFKRSQDTMSKYKSEEEYNTAVKQYGWQQKYQGKGYFSLQEMLGDLEEGSEEYNWLSNYSMSVITPDEADKAISKAQRAIDSGWDYINKYGQGSLARRYNNHRDEMTEEELAMAKVALEKYGSFEKMEEAVRKSIADNEKALFDMENAKASAKKHAELTGGYDPSKHQAQGQAGWAAYSKYVEDSKRESEERRKAQVATEKEKTFGDYVLEFFASMGQSPDTSLPLHIDVNQASKEIQDKDLQLRSPKDNWTDEQRETFGYLWETNRQKSYEYAYAVNTALAKQAEQEEIAKIQNWATQNLGTGILGTAGAIASAPLGLADYVYDMLENGTLGHISEGDGNITPFEYSQAVTSGISNELNGVDEFGVAQNVLPESIPVIGGKGFGDVYGLTTSILQSSAAVATGGSGQALITFFGSGAAAGVDDAIKRGATGDQALLYGASLGTAEALAENIGLDNLLKMGSSATAREFLWNLFKQGGIESLEEGVTTGLGEFADRLIMGDKSNFYLRYEAYRRTGISDEEAKHKAWSDFAEDVAFDMLGGFASGEVHAGAHTAVNNFVQNRNTQTATGRSIMETDGAVNSLMMLSDDMAGVTTGRKQKNLMRQTEKVSAKMDKGSTSNRTARKVAKLYNAVKGSYSMQNHADIVQALTKGESGFSKSDANKIAGALVAMSNGLELTEAQTDLLDSVKSNPAVLDIVESINSNESLIGQRNQQLRQFRQDVTVNAINKAITKQVTEKEFTPEGVYETSSGNKAIRTDTNEEIDIKGVKEISRGKLVLELSDGQTIDAKNVSFASESDALIYEAVGKLGDNISVDGANQLISQFKGGNAMVFARGIAQAYTYGFYGIDKSELFSKHSLADKLTDQQRDFAYNLGKEYRPTADKNAKDRAGEKLAKTGKTPGEKGVYFRDKDGNATDIDTYLKQDNRHLNDRQKSGIEMMHKMSEMMGIRFNVFESWVENGKKYYLDENGKKVEGDPNGFYDTVTGEIYIDLNAGSDYSGTMVFTIAHEVTHFMRQWSPEHFRKIAEIVYQHGGMKGSVSELAALKQANAKAKGKPISYDVALEEVIADGMETILKNGKVVQFMADVKQKDHSGWQKLKGWFMKLAKFLRAYIGKHANTVEGRKVSEFSKDLLSQIEQIYAEGAVEGGRHYQEVVDGVSEKKEISSIEATDKSESAEAVDIEVDANTESVAPAVLKSERTWTESDYVRERDKAAEEIAKAIGVTVKKAKDYIDSVNSIAKMIADDRVRLDYFSSPGRSSFVGNVEYGGSFDFSTLCKKRRLLTGTFTAIQKALPNTALTANEILDIRNRMKEKGLEVSCGLCYVEGSRANMGQFAKEFLKLYKQYYPDAWQPNMADVNTPDGIEWVRINHPECYEQYEYFWNHYGTLKPGDKNLFASQQKPKLYQLHTEYKGEILDKFNDDDNVEEKNLNGGIRLQSFSDFEIVHLIDTMQIIMDMSRVGLAGQAYTKVPDFAWALGDTGLKINLSLIAKGVDENGRLIFDDVEGMPIDTAVALRNRYSKNVGTILVAFNDEQLLAAMADDRVDFIIPFHRSQWKKSQYEAMGLPAKTKDYTYMQNEKFIKPQYHEYRGRMVKDKATNYMPNEYWDFSKSGKENAEAYLEMCARNNKRPKFYKFLQNNGDGSYSLKADGSTDGYWKLLIDFKMYDNDGNGSPQMPVKPEFNMDEATRMLNDYQGGHSNFPVAQGIVDSFVRDYKESHNGAMFSNRDADLEKLAENMEEGKYSLQSEDSSSDLDSDIKLSDREEDAYKEFARKVNSIINQSISGKGNIDGKVQVVDIMPVGPKLAAMVAKASGNAIDISNRGIALNTSDVWHEYKRHTSVSDEISRDQVAFTKRQFQNAVKCMISPDLVETIFADTNNPTQRQSFAYAKKTTRGHYVVVEAVGGKKNPCIYPVMIVQFSKGKWNKMMSEGKSLGEILHEGETRKLLAQDVEKNKKSRVTAAQFASYEAIANTLRSPQLDAMVSQPDGNVKRSDHDENGATFNGNALYQDRTEDSVSNRSLLANALEGVAKTDIERAKLKEYKDLIALLDEQEKKLRDLNAQIKELSFAKGPRDTKKISALRDEATKTANRISAYDKQLLRLEAAKPLQDVLAREKKKAYDKAAMEGRKALDAYKEKTAKTQRELLNKWKDSRKRAVESHERTVMRNKIRSVVGELNELLLNEDKKRHVPDNLKKAVASALALVNMDTVKAEERAAKYAALIAKETDPDKIDAYTITMENILRQGEKMGQKLKELRDAYEEIQNSDDPDIANGYDPAIAGAISELSASIGDTSLANMSIEQLSDVYDMYKMVLTKVRDANKSLIESIKESISNRASRVVGEVRAAGGEHKYRASILDPIRTFFWNNAKPVYAMEHIGSNAMTEAYNQVRKGEDTWAKDVTEARAYYLDKSKKYGYDSWDFDKKYTFKSASEMEFELTLEQILSLYAYSKREQAHDHLRLGGFVFDSNIETYKDDGSKLLKYKVNTADAHQITPEILAEITGTLTADQIGFVDEMQDYLSTVMGAKGNEVTMKMYGVKLFKEKFYFPLKSAKQFMFEQNEVSGEVRIKNSGFTNKVVAKANNPVILNNFMDVWANHVNDMSMYHSFVLPLEDFNRIFNYNSPKQENVPAVSVKGTIQNAYSPAAVNYIKQLITDLNGGAMSDPRETIAKSLTARFKKAKVFSSLSVVIQQPSAIGRAFALVDPKYFHPTVDGMNHDELWAELKQYAPVSVIKEMGYFDTNMGKSTQDFIKAKEYSSFKEKAKAFFVDGDYRDEILSKAPALADELTWCAIWNAVKRETLAKNPGLDIKSEPFLMLAGARFTEVVTKTQVYDSVLARSANMRSKSGLMSMVTSFMAEPTTAINMLEDALRKRKRGYKGYAGRVFASVAVSVILNNALVALVYGMRDDDEDETFAEKYMQAFVSGMIDDINPLTYLPYLKDMWSLLQGYDVERTDMSLVSDLADAMKSLVKAYTSEDGDVVGAWHDMVGSVANIGGVPLDNIRREINGAVNFFNTIIEDVNGRSTTWGSMGDALLATVKDSTPIWGWLPGDKKSDNLYDAIMSGDKAYVDRLKGNYKDEDAYHNAVRKALRENDPRITEAAKAQVNGDPSERVRIQKLIIADGFNRDDVIVATNTVINSMKPDEPASDPKEKGFYTAEDFAREIANGDQASANAVKVDIIQTSQKNGKSAEDAEKSFKNSAKDELKELYLADKISADKVINALVTYCGIERDDAVGDIQYWDFKQAYPEAFADDAWIDEYYAEVESSGISLKVFVDYRNKVKGITGDGKKKRRMDVIHSMPISSAQKDALYFAEGWAASTLYEAPWH